MNGFRIFDLLLAFLLIVLFYAGFGIGSQAYGFTNFTATNISITGNLYVRGNIGDAPDNNVVLIFNTSCPTGWVRQTQYDNAYPRGNDTYSSTQVGNATHTHPVGSHSHGASGFSVDDNNFHGHAMGWKTTSSDGDHTHSQPGSSDTPNGGSLTGACAGVQTYGSGDHSHSVLMSSVDQDSTAHSMTGTSGSTSGTLAAANNDPPYIQLVFCSKV